MPSASLIYSTVSYFVCFILDSKAKNILTLKYFLLPFCMYEVLYSKVVQNFKKNLNQPLYLI